MENNHPVINAVDKTIYEGDSFNALSRVTASDIEDGNLTSSIKVTTNTVNTKKPGTYQVTFQVTDKNNNTTTKTIKVTVKENKAPVITASDKEITINKEFKVLENIKATDQEDGDLTSKIKVTTNTVNTKVLGTYKVIYEVTDSKNKKTTKEIKVQVVKDRVPTINASNKTILIGDEFNPLKGVTASDPEDGDITKNIKVIENTVNKEEFGKYKVTYQVTDSASNKATKTIEVTVVEDTMDYIDSLQEKDSIFYFDYLKVINNKLSIKGYNAIKGINNTLDTDINFILVYESLNNDDLYIQPIDRITNKSEITRPVFSNDGKDYTYSWFKGNIDLASIPSGDYKLYIFTYTDKYYSMSIISNKVLKEQTAFYKGEKAVTTRNNYLDNDLPIELVIREESIGEKNATSTYNQYNQHRTLEFTNDLLHIKGTSYSYGMNLSESSKIERKIIFENTDNYKKYTYDLGSITNGLYEVGTTLNDKLNKTRAWFDKTIDISNIPKGNYAIYISNKANISDYGELNELLQRDLSKVTKTINGKKYRFTVNKENRYRIELIVE